MRKVLKQNSHTHLSLTIRQAQSVGSRRMYIAFYLEKIPGILFKYPNKPIFEINNKALFSSI